MILTPINYHKIQKQIGGLTMTSKRLIYKDEFGETHTTDEKINGKFVGDRAVREKLFEYEQEESEGKLVHLPCKVGDTVWVITSCEDIIMLHDNDYFTGTGAIECPFEDTCDFEECDNTNVRIFKTIISSIYSDCNGWYLDFKNLAERDCNINQIGKTVFLTPEAAEQALKESSDA